MANGSHSVFAMPTPTISSAEGTYTVLMNWGDRREVGRIWCLLDILTSL